MKPTTFDEKTATDQFFSSLSSILAKAPTDERHTLATNFVSMRALNRRIRDDLIASEFNKRLVRTIEAAVLHELFR